jgi:hydroxymethylpyrimidine pyrophosphatase-like HAD family hydrolase
MIATDVDGTLLDNKGQIPQENLEAIVEAASRGIEIVLVTGRRFDFALPIAQAIPCDVHLLVNNGALAKSREGATLMRSLLPRETALQILEATTEFREYAGVVFDRHQGDRVILETVDWDDPVRGGYLRRNREHIGICSPLVDCLNGENADKSPGEDPIEVVFSGNCGPIRAAMEKLEGVASKDGFSLSLTEYLERDLSVLDVLRRGLTKGSALRAWSALRSIKSENVMAIGDNWNDLEMLGFAGTPVVMGNSVNGLKTRGWPVTGSNEQAGLADAIRTYALSGATEAV